MAPKSRSLLFIFLFSILMVFFSDEASAVLGGGKGARVGGWRPIDDLKNPQVVEIAKFAVEEHNKQAKTSLKFAAVVKGETQTVAGTNYKLVISAKDGGAAAKNYEAVVWDKPWQKFRQLTSFEAIKG
ncbi:hypothetical protein BUALT_Bualt17G0026000 [Buddleja alternifolia]|uniref:Cystatin domain-containing protein n=1 Tax=Buddleja alternifolia TaxID=168488 RepID=A0AAV6WEY4_9LAMI|nr:hypothetical protein BUALT_Bualt17G0026000 [Buddleja alternifolia]